MTYRKCGSEAAEVSLLPHSEAGETTGGGWTAGLWDVHTGRGLSGRRQRSYSRRSSPPPSSVNRNTRSSGQ